MLLSISAVLALPVVLACSGAANAALPLGKVETYPVPDLQGGFPTSITSGPDGALWFADEDGGLIDRVTTAGVFSEFPAASEHVDWITAGPSGNEDLWFSDVGDAKVGRSTTSGTQTEYSLAESSGGLPEAITAGPDEALWFTVDTIGDLGTIDRVPITATVGDPAITEYKVPTADPEALYIVAGPDGNLWFTETRASKVSRLTPTGTFTEFSLPAGDTNPGAIASGPGGALWFLDRQGIGKATPAGAITQLTLPDPPDSSGLGTPEAIAAGPDGNVWFAANDGLKTWIGRMTPAGTVTYYPLAESIVAVNSMTAGPDGNVWFTEDSPVDKVGEIGTVSGSEAAVSLSPPAGLEFGNSLLGKTAGPKTATVTNTGDAPLVLGTVKLVGPVGTPFAASADECSGQTVAPGGSCTIAVSFSPTIVGSDEASLQFPDNAAGSPQSLALSGSSEPVFAASALSFGPVALDQAAGPREVRIQNTGGAPMEVSGVALTGPQASSFGLDSDGCSGQSVPPGGSCDVGVSFTPTVAGEDSASLSVSDNAGASPQSVALTGTGSARTLDFSAVSLNFGAVSAGVTSAPQSVTATNPGPSPVTFGAIALAGPQASAFAIGADTCAGQTIGAGGSCSMTVSFAPAADSGGFSAVLQIADNATGAPQSVSLSGETPVSAAGAAELSGAVTDSSAGEEPLASVFVSVCPVETSFASKCTGAYTGANGDYDVPGLSPGLWHAQVWPTGGLAGGTLTGASADVTLASGASVKQNFVVHAPVPLSGGVVFSGSGGVTSSGEPVENVGSPFSISVPVQVRGHQTPDSTRVYAFLGNIHAAGGSGEELGGVVLFSVQFDASGNPERMSDLVESQLECGPLGTPSPCAELPGFGADASAASLRAVASRSNRGRLDPIASAAGCTSSPAGERGQFNLTPTPNGGIQIEVYLGFGDYIQIPLAPIGFNPPAPTGNFAGDAELSLGIAALNGLITTRLPYNTVIGLLNNVATVMHPSSGELTVGNVLNGVVTMGLESLGGGMHGQFQWGASVVNNTLGNVLGEQQGAKPPTPCPPPPPPGKAPSGEEGTGGGGEGDFYLDPSGQVRTTKGVPLQDAKVTLTRAGSARAPQVKVPQGSVIMSPGNRVNPVLTGPLGAFGWDVLPGFYEISASRRGCTAPKGGSTQRSAVRQVPPAVEGLLLKLRCRTIRRRATRMRVSALAGADGSFVLSVHVTERGAHLPGLGTITFKLGSRTLAALAPKGATGIAVLDGVGLHPGRNFFTVSYGGDAALAPSVAHVTVKGKA